MVQVRDGAVHISEVTQSHNPLGVFSLVESDNLRALVSHDHSGILHSPDGFLVDESSLGHRRDQIVQLLPVLLQGVLRLDSRTTDLIQTII